VRERIATVTSFRANIPGIYDVSFTTNTRHWTDLQSMYKEWANYRLNFLAKELEAKVIELQKSAPVDLDEFKKFANSQIDYMQRTQRQMVPYDFQRESLSRYGLNNYTVAPEIWEQIKAHPDFEQRLAAIDPDASWKYAKEYVGDLAYSKAALAHGETIQGQVGPIQGLDSQYNMGDELIRQGQRELFFVWADKTGLLTLKVN
jgi:hypothetical protein